MEHVPESELAVYAFDPAAVPAERRRAIESHIAECAECRALNDFFAVAEEDLSDVDVWERGIGSATYESLMAHAARITAEDEEAGELLGPMLDTPARVAFANLHRQKRFLTGGVVRQLNARALALRESEPLAALTFADTAIAIAETLPDDLYPGKAIHELRGKAWEHRAAAQMFLGEFTAAFDSLDHAERAHKHLASPAFGLAAVALIRASVYYCQQRFVDAEQEAQKAERAYTHLGDADRRMNALHLRGGIRFEARDLSGAITLFDQVLEYGEGTGSARWIARASNALGNCECERGNLGDASLHFHKALPLLREIGPASERISAEWGIARVLLRAGKRQEAIRRLRDAAAEFEARGIVTDAALVTIDIADGLLALGQTHEIVKLAAHMFRVFTDAGMLTGALTAMAYIKEAAAARRLTPDDLQAVRVFLQRSRRQPEMLFVPPPSGNR
jgi:tetratricopeptide (TPR) repeat protein